ncbi:unnamed protein product, partial [Nesidiocoris tenuis]
TSCGRLSRRGPQNRTFPLPPEVVVQRLELSRRSLPPSGNEASNSGTETATPHPHSGRLTRFPENPGGKKKKKEQLPQPAAPDPRKVPVECCVGRPACHWCLLAWSHGHVPPMGASNSAEDREWINFGLALLIK